MCVCGMYVCMYVCMQFGERPTESMYVCMYVVCMYVCMYVCGMYVCMYAIWGKTNRKHR